MKQIENKTKMFNQKNKGDMEVLINYSKFLREIINDEDKANCLLNLIKEELSSNRDQDIDDNINQKLYDDVNQSVIPMCCMKI